MDKPTGLLKPVDFLLRDGELELSSEDVKDSSDVEKKDSNTSVTKDSSDVEKKDSNTSVTMDSPRDPGAGDTTTTTGVTTQSTNTTASFSSSSSGGHKCSVSIIHDLY